MAKPEKVQFVSELADKINEAKSILLTDFTGLNVEEISELRTQLRQSSVEYKVVKNTLAKLSVEQVGLTQLLEYLQSPTAMAFGMDDPLAPAKVISEYMKKKDKPTIKAFVFNGDVYKSDQVKELAKLPSQDILVAQLLGVISAPLTNFVSLLQNILQNLVIALNEIKKKKVEQ